MCVRALEHESDLLKVQVEPLERALKAAEEKFGRFVHNEPTNDADGQHASANFSTLLAADRQKYNAIAADLVPLRERLARVEIDLEAARRKRDDALNAFTAAEAKKK